MTRALLALQAQTLFEMTPSRRLVRVRAPDRPPAPRFYMAGGPEGCVAYVRDDLDAARERAIADLIAREPPMRAPGATPRFAPAYREILDAGPLSDHNYGPVHRLPRHHATSKVMIVAQASPEGDALVDRIRHDGMPRGLFEAGFVDLSHFWPPWCVALVGDDVAAIAFCVCDGVLAREIGVHTVAAYRGRGFAAAVTTAWSGMHPRHGVLFYSTHRDNLSSQRVIARLGLPWLAESMRIA